ncbi:MAG: sulfotransferase [Bacteroidota bacterium]
MRVLITGGPRSGTSFLAGLIRAMGLHPGRERHLKLPDLQSRKGYWEHQRLLDISRQLLVKMKADFHHQLPQLEPGWTQHFSKEKAAIRQIVHQEKIDFYKGNRLLVLADLYDELFPKAKWFCIRRNVEATYQSRFGKSISRAEWQTITENRYAAWQRTAASRKAVELDYDAFKTEPRTMILKITQHLGLPANEADLQRYQQYFKPRSSAD